MHSLLPSTLFYGRTIWEQLSHDSNARDRAMAEGEARPRGDGVAQRATVPERATGNDLSRSVPGEALHARVASSGHWQPSSDDQSRSQALRSAEPNACRSDEQVPEEDLSNRWQRRSDLEPGSIPGAATTDDRGGAGGPYAQQGGPAMQRSGERPDTGSVTKYGQSSSTLDAAANSAERAIGRSGPDAFGASDSAERRIAGAPHLSGRLPDRDLANRATPALRSISLPNGYSAPIIRVHLLLTSEAGHPVTRLEIASRLGIGVTRVSQALGALKEQGLAANTRHGFWTAARSAQ